MTIADANQLPNAAELPTDICIVGAGPAGITLATELQGTTRHVCLLESGAYHVEPETQALYDLQTIGHPMRQNFMSRARYFGGTSNLWPGRSMILNPIDLQPREWVPDSGWPISYAELAEYYDKAVTLLRLPGAAGFSPDTWHAVFSAPEKAIFRNGELTPVVAAWGKRPLRFSRAYRRQLAGAANVQVYLNANVTKLEMNRSGGVVSRVHVACLSGKRFTVKPRLVILACGGIENARLLLVSDGPHGKGLGNDHDLVGRYYMDHPRAVFGRVRLRRRCDMTRLLGFPTRTGKIQVGIALSPELQRRERLLNNYISLETKYSEYSEKAYHSLVQVAKRVLRKGYAGNRLRLASKDMTPIPDLIYHLAPREILPHSIYRWYVLLKKRSKRHLVVVNYCEQQPNPASRVVLGDKCDRFGNNLPVLDWRIGDREMQTVERLQELVAAHLAENDLGDLDNTSADAGSLTFTDASHHIGTTRMHDDPRRGVVGRNLKVHDTANLYIAGSSVFPTAGHANPTLTIVALALRLADHLKSVRW